MDDPLSYFEGKVRQFQDWAGRNEFIGAVERSEREARENIADYDQAAEFLERGRIAELERMYPDRHPQAAAIARHHDFKSPAALRGAILNHDRIAVAQHALRNGQSPARLYYDIARQRGYEAKPGLDRHTSRQMVDLANAAEDGNEQAGERFDKEWDALVRAGRL